MLDRLGWIRGDAGNGHLRVELTPLDIPRWLRLNLPEGT
jgi:hypothetical protein